MTLVETNKASLVIALHHSTYLTYRTVLFIPEDRTKYSKNNVKCFLSSKAHRVVLTFVSLALSQAVHTARQSCIAQFLC